MRKNKLFGPGSFYLKAMAIAIPAMLQALIQGLVSLIDNFMVAGLGDVKMSGVNIAGQLLYAFMILQAAICTAGGIFLTQYCGAGDKKGMRQAFAFKVFVSGICCILYFVITMVIPRQALSLMVIGNKQAAEILDQGTPYMFLMGFIGIQSMISTIIATSYREIGKVRAPLVITVIATLVNTFLNWVLIYGNLGMPRLEVKGAAYATIIARTVECFLFVGYALIDKPDFISIKEIIHINFGLLGRILKRGWMVIVSQLLWITSETIASAVYNSRGGAEVVSGMSSCFAIMNLILISITGINTATSVLIGKSLGANELDKARREKNWMLSAAVALGVIMTVFGFVSTLLIPVVFYKLSPEAQNICRGLMIIVSILLPLWIYINTELSIMKAGGDTRACMFVDGVMAVAVVIMLLIMARFSSLGPLIMYILVKSFDILKVIVGQIQVKKERWVVNLAK